MRARAASGLVAVALALPAVAGARGSLCRAARPGAHAPVIAVVSAFPAELAPLVAAATIARTAEAGGRPYYVGELDGVHVVLGFTGIGLVNATNSATAVVTTFHPAALIMTGVAGSRQRIADVLVADAWLFQSFGQIFPANPAMVALARRGAAALPAPLERCTVPPTSTTGGTVCMPFDPAVVFVPQGQSDDPYGGHSLACQTTGAYPDVFGCNLPAPAVVGTSANTTDVDIQDMETAAVARIASQRHVPFVGVRAVSDGAGDPLGDRGFPGQFFDYYRLAAANEALVTRGVLAELARVATDRRLCGLLARRRWRAAAARLAAG